MAVGALVGLLGAVPPAPAGADARAEQAEVRRKKAQAAARLDVLKASDAEVERALEALDASVVDTTDLVGQSIAAERRAVLAEEAAARRLADGEERLRAALEGLRGQAVYAYTRPMAAFELSADASPGEISRSLVYAEIRTGQSTDKLDEVRAARADLAATRKRASKSREEAARQRTASERRLADLEGLQVSQRSVIESLEAKVAASEEEVDLLAASDAELGAAIARQDAEAAARRRAQLLAEQQAALDRAARAAPPTTSAPSGRSGLIQGILPSSPSSPSRPVTSAPAGPGLTTVRGITVASSIAGQLASLLAASDKAGLVLSGGGYRAPQAQIAVRQANCGPTNYDIYEKPASQCSPPTAKPGSSMHERGLAVDFANRGSTISSRSNPAFIWLSGNAGRYGFRNLPSEPWHWSTNGN